MSKGGLGIDSRTDDPNPHPVSFQIDGLEQLLYDHLAPQLEVEWDPVCGTCSR